jgi:hypothetical protein
VLLPNICEIRSGYTARGRLEVAQSGGVLAIQLGDVAPEGRVQVGHLTRLQIDVPPDRYFVGAGDVLFRSRGEKTTAAAIPQEFPEAALALLPLIVLRPLQGSLLPEYLAWAINQAPAQRHLEASARGTSMRMIPRAAFDDLNIDVPDLHTQRLIVETAELAGRERKLASEIADKRHQLVHAALVAAATHRAHSVERKTK